MWTQPNCPLLNSVPIWLLLTLSMWAAWIALGIGPGVSPVLGKVFHPDLRTAKSPQKTQ